jgi:hypothetical protein
MSRDKVQQKKKQKEHYERNKDRYIVRQQTRRANRRFWFSKLLDSLSCQLCPEDAKECLDFHHIDPTEKEDDVSNLLSSFRAMSRVIKEIEKCVCLCANCHRKVHKGTLIIDGLKPIIVDEIHRNFKQYDEIF